MVMLFNYSRVGRQWFLRSAIFALAFCTFLLSYDIGLVQGQEGLSLTITPPLFQVSLQPGEAWSSGITVVNNNPYDVTLFAETVLFEPSEESGRPVFFTDTPSQAQDGSDASTFAGWITTPQEAISIVREQTYTLPFTIQVPEDAAPGGHYAAILIGNRPPEGVKEESLVSVTSSMAALFFLTVSGDVIEKGRVRDFFTEQTLYENAEASFSLRFENQGNVHLLPQGNITIFNMFGKERGVIPVNAHRDYGTVLPGSIRKYSFTWKSDSGLWDIGRYKAEVTLGYGKDTKQSALATTYFYVLPIIPLLEILLGFVFLLVSVSWAIRVYIRKALLLEQGRVTQKHVPATVANMHVRPMHTREEVLVRTRDTRVGITTLVRPIQEGFVDLRSVRPVHTQLAKHAGVKVFTLGAFLKKYKLFFMFIALFGAGAVALSVYLKDVTRMERDFSVTEVRSDGSEVLLTE